MIVTRRSGALAGALVVLVLSGCVDSTGVTPNGAMSPSFALTSGFSSEAEGFYFLPPIVDEPPTIVGTFNPDLLPSLRVCELVGEPGPAAACVDGPPLVSLPPGSSTVEPERYEIEWDTDGPETGTIDPDRFYRLEVLVADQVQGSVDLDPADRNEVPADGPFQFFVGETIPVAFWLGVQVLCEGESFVTECLASAVIDESGGTLVLDQEGDKLAVTIFEDALPGENAPPITVTVERIDPELFREETGSDCLPLFDAPQFADCFRVTTVPELAEPLDAPALVSICLDPTILDGINLPEGQENQLTMIRFDEDGAGEWQALPDVAGDCPTISGSLLRVPDSGLFRYAALGVNAIADVFAPEPLAARDLRLGALTSSFSRFRYALPGQMLVADGDGELVQVGQSPDVEVVVEVIDHEGLVVENAIVHFESADGTLSAPEATSDASGTARVTWTVDNLTPGVKTLTASALGLLADAVPEHSDAYFFTTEEITFTATVVGPPASIERTPEGTIVGTAGESGGELAITVVDADGNPVGGAAVTWEGDGEVVGGEVTGNDGVATGEWILSTSAGVNAITATVGGLSVTFDSEVLPGPPARITGMGGGVTAPAGSVVPISISVADQYGNGRPDESVVWSATQGGGTVAGAPETGADGVARAEWTLGLSVGENQATAAAGGLQVTFTATGACIVGFGTARPDGHFDSEEWACADSFDFVIRARHGGDDDDDDDDDGYGRRGDRKPKGTPATVYWMNDAENIYFAVRVKDGSFRRQKSLRLDFDNDGDGRTEYRDDVIGYDVRQDRVFDAYLGRWCALRRGRSACSTRDRSVDVVGDISSEGSYTTYELAHPLGGDAQGQDLSRTAGDPLGFFLTLYNGRGAWAGTHAPGFRDYRRITIAGPPG